MLSLQIINKENEINYPLSLTDVLKNSGVYEINPTKFTNKDVTRFIVILPSNPPICMLLLRDDEGVNRVDMIDGNWDNYSYRRTNEKLIMTIE